MKRTKSAKATAAIRIPFRSRRRMHAIADALRPEIAHPAGHRAQAQITTRGSLLVLNFEAKDSSTLRAILSSYVRMLAASLKVSEALAQLESPAKRRKQYEVGSAPTAT